MTTRIDRRRILQTSLALALIGGSWPRKGRAQWKARYTFVAAGLDTREAGSPQNTDILIIARVDLDAEVVRALSIPRDLYVEIPGHGPDKITRAFDHGITSDPDGAWESGAARTVATVETNFGVEIDGMATTDFDGFPEIVDAVGGITVDNPYEVRTGEYGSSDGEETVFAEGEIELDGELALVFARTRQQDGDNGRVMRQQLVLAALFDKIQDPEVVDDLPALIDAAREMVETDISFPTQLRLIDGLRDLDADDVTFGTIVDQLTEGETASGMWIYEADWSTLPGYVQAWLDGEIT